MNESATYPRLSKAPIEEAIISLTIVQQKYASLTDVEKVCGALQKYYPQRKTWAFKEFAVQMSDVGVNTSHQEKTNGFILSSEDGKKIAHR